VIPAANITAWATTRPWPTREQIEQDLILARTIQGIYSHPLLGNELVFRGGTCLHQVHLPSPLRYSEDLDFVRRTHTEIGPIFDALRLVGEDIGLLVHSTSLGQHPKIKFQTTSTDTGAKIRIKVEINTYETAPAKPLIELPFSVSSPWFSGSCNSLTFTPEELVATKIRALFQRSKGRDVFDLWLALNQLNLDPSEIIGCFAPYRPENYSAEKAIDNLRSKLLGQSFQRDLEPLVSDLPAGYNVMSAAEQIIDELLRKIK
jgi:hypothetical protein